MNKLSIIIPCHDEEKRIGDTLYEYLYFFEQAVKEQKLKEYEIIVVLNKTTDKTKQIVEEYQKINTPLYYLDLTPGGKGFAILEGFKEALRGKSDYIGFVDADCSTSPDEFFRLAMAIKEEDGVIASRYKKGAIVNPKQSLKRVIVSRIFNRMIRLLFRELKYTDTQCGAKIFKRSAIEEIQNEIGNTQWAFDVDLLYQLVIRGFKIKEEPTTWSDKEYSKINFKRAGIRMGLAVIRLRLWHSKLRGIVKIYNKLPEAIKLHHKI